VTAYPTGSGLRAMVSLCAPGAAAAGGLEMLEEMAEQMRQTAKCLRRIGEAMDKTEKKEEKAG